MKNVINLVQNGHEGWIKTITKAKIEKAYRAIQKKESSKGFSPDQFLGKIKSGGNAPALQKAIEVRRKTKQKLPDAIVCATAI